MIPPLPPPVVRVLLAGKRQAALTIARDRREDLTAHGGRITAARAKKYMGITEAHARAVRVVRERFAAMTERRDA